jgi:hypothetical protein
LLNLFGGLFRGLFGGLFDGLVTLFENNRIDLKCRILFDAVLDKGIAILLNNGLLLREIYLVVRVAMM